MIVTEAIIINGRELIRTTSDAGRYVVRGGIVYEEAVDPAEYATERVYTEGDVMPTEVSDMTETKAKAMAYDILVGEAE